MTLCTPVIPAQANLVGLDAPDVVKVTRRYLVIPAKAGIQSAAGWTPACAGVTKFFLGGRVSPA